MIFFKMASIVVIISVVVYTYMKKFNPFVILISVFGLIAMWTIIIAARKYLEITVKKTEANLQQKLISSEADAKEIISLLGD